jgi:hypothetical protein
MQLLRSTDPNNLPECVSFACPSGCRDEDNMTQRVAATITTHPGPEGTVLLEWAEHVSCPSCHERIDPGVIEETVRRQLGELVR